MTAVVTDRGEKLTTTCVVSNVSTPVMYNELIGVDRSPKEKYDEMRGSTWSPEMNLSLINHCRRLRTSEVQ